MSRLWPYLRNNWKYLTILSALSLVYFLLYLAGILFIQFILFFAYVALFPALLVREKNNLNKRVWTHNLSEDERWSKTKSAIDKLSDRIDKSKNQAEKKSLQIQKLSLESELRRLEWQVKESDMTQMYNASKGNLKRLDDPESIAGQSTKVELPAMDAKESREFLLKIIKDIHRILKDEPPDSVREALIPITNDLRAHYYVLKKRGTNGSNKTTSDYFVMWATLSSFVRGISPDPELVRYGSYDFSPRLAKVQQSIKSVGEVQKYLKSPNNRYYDDATSYGI